MKTASEIEPDKQDTKTLIRRSLTRAALLSLLLPVVLLVFFVTARPWLNERIRGKILQSIEGEASFSAPDRAERLAFFREVDFAEIVLNCPPGLEGLRDNLEQNGLGEEFRRLRWGLWGATALVTLLATTIVSLLILQAKARTSREALITHYRLGWRLCTTVMLLNILLLVPLLTYACFEFTVLLSDRYFPKLIVMLVIGGIIALWQSIRVLMQRVPLEFEEPMAREVLPAELPQLWAAINDASRSIGATPPDHLVLGMQPTFYVTEFALKHGGGTTSGRTLYLPYPLLRHLAADDVMAVVGHELGHFLGEDTRLSRDFFPMRRKAQATTLLMAQAGIVAWPSRQLGELFGWSFTAVEQEHSRERELLADQVSARLTSSTTAARALIRVHVVLAAFQEAWTQAMSRSEANPFNLPLRTVITEHFAGKPEFWQTLANQHSPHPLDSHPPLAARLVALGHPYDPASALGLATADFESAHARWLEGRETLFSQIGAEAERAVEQAREQAQLTAADSDTEAGRSLLEAHFPTLRWPDRGYVKWVYSGSLGLLAGIAMFISFAVDSPARGILAVVALLLAWAAHSVYRYKNHGWLEVTATTLQRSTWSRPLLFADVEGVNALNQNGTVTLTFKLKNKQPAFEHWSIIRWKRTTLSVSLSSLKGKQVEIAETLLRYYTRQAAPKNDREK